MSLTAIGVGMAALAVIGGGLGIGFATSSAVKAIAQQPEAHGKIRSTLLIGAALAEATAIYGFVLGIHHKNYASRQKARLAKAINEIA